MELLRDESFFVPDTQAKFRMVLYQVNTQETGFKTLLQYRLTRNDKELFAGSDFGCSPLHAIDSDQALLTCLSFLCLRPGGVDREYFDAYTPDQMVFAQSDEPDLLMLYAAEQFREAGRALGYEFEDEAELA